MFGKMDNDCRHRSWWKVFLNFVCYFRIIVKGEAYAKTTTGYFYRVLGPTLPWSLVFMERKDRK